MLASICMAVHDRPEILRQVLISIFSQGMSHNTGVEVIVVDDRSQGGGVARVCQRYPVLYTRLEGPPGYRNPSRARNVAYRMAKGDIIISQSADTLHVGRQCIANLVSDLMPGCFLIARVFNTDLDGHIVPGNLENPGYNALTVYTGPENPRPFFFLGSLYRRDLYAVGGNDEEFTAPGREDAWFADCLMKGLGLSPVFLRQTWGYHIQHKHLGTKDASMPSLSLYRKKYRAAREGKIPWCASGGPWPSSPDKGASK